MTAHEPREIGTHEVPMGAETVGSQLAAARELAERVTDSEEAREAEFEAEAYCDQHFGNRDEKYNAFLAGVEYAQRRAQDERVTNRFVSDCICGWPLNSHNEWTEYRPVEHCHGYTPKEG